MGRALRPAGLLWWLKVLASIPWRLDPRPLGKVHCVLPTSSPSAGGSKGGNIHPPGSATLAFCRSGTQTVLSRALAVSPLRVLTPRNHGSSAWVFLASLGGGLVHGGKLAGHADIAEGASAFLATQASTKVYRSAHGCSASLTARVEKGAELA